jgi:hypothetical protein
MDPITRGGALENIRKLNDDKAAKDAQGKAKKAKRDVEKIEKMKAFGELVKRLDDAPFLLLDSLLKPDLANLAAGLSISFPGMAAAKKAVVLDHVLTKLRDLHAAGAQAIKPRLRMADLNGNGLLPTVVEGIYA